MYTNVFVEWVLTYFRDNFVTERDISNLDFVPRPCPEWRQMISFTEQEVS